MENVVEDIPVLYNAAKSILTISATKEGILSTEAIASSSLKNPHPGKQDEKEPTLALLYPGPQYAFQDQLSRLPGRIFEFSRESHELFAGSRRSSTASAEFLPLHVPG
uniref:Uncharacterized protein n=1 Tax=Candidatus Caldatribacterium saccharofermentans TaxID=1454753 RepID=A0A7V4TH75_9BACT